jgi:glutaconate CoA-transferase subunit A
MPLSEAIRRFVTDGCSIVTGTYMEQKIPFAAAHEIIRQKKRDLTLIGPISDILFDQLIGAGCVRCVQAAWIGNVMMGSAYNFRQAVEEGVPHRLEVVDYSNFTLALGLHAAALGVSFLPTHSTLGSTLLEENPNLVRFASPDGNGRVPIVAVRAIHPDVAIVHACRADENGNGMAWGNLGVTVDAVMAARDVVVVAEEIVEAAEIRRTPNSVIIPGYRVAAVCHVPWGCHPSPVHGYHERDHEWFVEYHKASRSREGFEAWLKQWVFNLTDHRAYLDQVGEKRLAALRPGREAVINRPVGS